MNNLLHRTITVLGGLAILIPVILFMPWYNYLVLNIIILAMSFMAGVELTRIYRRLGTPIHPNLGGTISMLPALILYVTTLFQLPGYVTPLAGIGIPMVIVSLDAFPKSSTRQDRAITRIPYLLSLLIYPGVLMMYILKITLLPNPTIAMLSFLTLVFSNDVFAYLVGSLLGKRTRGIFVVSQNKSAVGLFGGMAGTVLGGMALLWIFPEFWGGVSINSMTLFAVAVSLLAVVGDLLESAIKRGGNVKDSGKLMQGRGGVLDSIDSLMYTAPLFYYYILTLSTTQ